MWLNFLQIQYYISTSGFWPRVRARALRAPVILISLPSQTGRCAPPAYRSFAAFIYPPKLSLRSELGRHGCISFHWAKLHPTELNCVLLSYAAPS
jgi:hypothetical protein